jgi:hypothetical protein
MAGMSKQRDRAFLISGLLLGFGAGLFVGLGLLVAALVTMFHHMFIIGFQWSSPGFWLTFVVVPLSLIVSGTMMLRRAKVFDQ